MYKNNVLPISQSGQRKLFLDTGVVAHIKPQSKNGGYINRKFNISFISLISTHQHDREELFACLQRNIFTNYYKTRAVLILYHQLL